MQTKSQKADIVKDLEQKVADQKVVIFSNFHGLSVTKQQELRRVLRKDDAEIKVTKKTLFQSAPVVSAPKEKERMPVSESVEEKGKIYNSMPTPSQKEEKKDNSTDEDDDEWGAVPAFLRRSKLK